jgi:tRNA modification GTPase
MSHPDTIVAAATPPGRGGVGIVRVSGPKTPQIAATLVGDLPAARQATLASFRDAAGQPIDIGIALFFPGPQSYTGEHVLELQGHGGPVVVEALVARVLELGARRARPGEFTERAFHNDKLDLAQAEAVADLIDAGSQEAARAAMRSLQGEFSSMVQGLTDALIDLRTYVEAAIDFPEEEVDFLGDTALAERLATVRAHFDAVSATTRPSSRRSRAPPATCCANASTSMACRCTYWTQRDCAIPRTSWNVKACGAPPPRCRAPTGCCSSSIPRTIPTARHMPKSALVFRPMFP